MVTGMPTLTSANALLLNSDEEVRHEAQLQRKRERAARAKRLDKTKAMRTEVAALEQMELVLRLAPDCDAIWDEFLDDDTKRVRGALRRFVPAAQEIKELLHEKSQLHRLLAEHELARKMVTDLLNAAAEMGDWEAKTQRWKALSKQHFRPLDIVQCAKHINAALVKMELFLNSTDRQTTGLTFMGWRDSRRLDVSSSSLQFSLDKVYRNEDMDHHMKMMWRMYTEAELYSSIIMGGRARVSIDILQEISPTIWVVRLAGAYDDLPVTVHELYLFFRIDTEDGVVQYIKAIPDAGIQDAINSPSDLWAANYFWVEWKVLDHSRPWSSTNYSMALGGALQGNDPAYLNRWLFELLAAAVRSDNVILGRSMLDFS